MLSVFKIKLVSCKYKTLICLTSKVSFTDQKFDSENVIMGYIYQVERHRTLTYVCVRGPFVNIDDYKVTVNHWIVNIYICI